MENSLTLSLSGNSSVLEVQYFPPIELSPDKNYVLGLVDVLTFNSIPNIDTGNNYEVEDIANFLRETLALNGISFSLKLNNNILRSVIKCSQPINFRPQDSIGYPAKKRRLKRTGID